MVLKLKPNASLNPSVAASIVALVAGAVEGLKPEQVTVLDTSGRILSEQGGSESGAVPSSLQLEHKRRHETYLAKQAEEMLAQYLGPGHAIVRVAADLNFKTMTETKDQYDKEVSEGGHNKPQVNKLRRGFTRGVRQAPPATWEGRPPEAQRPAPTIPRKYQKSNTHRP